MLINLQICVASMSVSSSTLGELTCQKTKTEFQKRARCSGAPERGHVKVSLSQLGPLQEKGKYCLLKRVTLAVLEARQNQQAVTNSPDQSRT